MLKQSTEVTIIGSQATLTRTGIPCSDAVFGDGEIIQVETTADTVTGTTTQTSDECVPNRFLPNGDLTSTGVTAISGTHTNVCEGTDRSRHYCLYKC